MPDHTAMLKKWRSIEISGSEKLPAPAGWPELAFAAAIRTRAETNGQAATRLSARAARRVATTRPATARELLYQTLPTWVEERIVGINARFDVKPMEPLMLAAASQGRTIWQAIKAARDAKYNRTRDCGRAAFMPGEESASQRMATRQPVTPAYAASERAAKRMVSARTGPTNYLTVNL